MLTTVPCRMHPQNKDSTGDEKLTAKQLGEYYTKLTEDFPIVSIEDGFDQVRPGSLSSTLSEKRVFFYKYSNTTSVRKASYRCRCCFFLSAAGVFLDLFDPPTQLAALPRNVRNDFFNIICNAIRPNITHQCRLGSRQCSSAPCISSPISC